MLKKTKILKLLAITLLVIGGEQLYTLRYVPVARNARMRQQGDENMDRLNLHELNQLEAQRDRREQEKYEFLEHPLLSMLAVCVFGTLFYVGLRWAMKGKQKP